GLLVGQRRPRRAAVGGAEDAAVDRGGEHRVRTQLRIEENRLNRAAGGPIRGRIRALHDENVADPQPPTLRLKNLRRGDARPQQNDRSTEPTHVLEHESPTPDPGLISAPARYPRRAYLQKGKNRK